MFQDQKGDLDCFPTCFKNALHYYNIDIPRSVEKRLKVFKNGTTDCSPQAADRPDYKSDWDRSLNKFGKEWRNACTHKNTNGKIPLNPEEQWALELLAMGMEIFFGSRPINQKKLFIKKLNEGHFIICDVVIQSETGLECKHAVLIVGTTGDSLLLHDPLLRKNACFIDNSNIFSHDEHGTNLKIRCDYFFNPENIGYLKPNIQVAPAFENHFLIVSK